MDPHLNRPLVTENKPRKLDIEYLSLAQSIPLDCSHSVVRGHFLSTTTFRLSRRRRGSNQPRSLQSHGDQTTAGHHEPRNDFDHSFGHLDASSQLGSTFWPDVDLDQNCISAWTSGLSALLSQNN